MVRIDNLNNSRGLKIFYGYIVVFAAFFTAVVSCGTFFSFGIFFKPVLTEFGWTRAATSGAYSLAFILSGLLSMIAGRLNDRFGPRLVITACGVLMGSGYLLMSHISTIWQLYLFYGIIIGAGYSATNIPMLSTVARWFVKRKGLMSGMVVSGIGVGMMIMPPVSRWLISTYDWRTAYTFIGFIVLVTIILAGQFMRRDPGQMGLLPYGECEVKKQVSVTEARVLSLGEAIHTRKFWLFFAILVSIGFWLQAVFVHITPHATDIGVSPAAAATILTVMGALSIPGKIILGSAGDKIGNRLAYIIFLVLVSASLFWLVPANQLWMLYLFAIVFGFGQGGGSALWSPIVAELFGMSSHGVILGAINVGHTIGGTVGPVIAGYIFDTTGSYYLAFILCAIACVTGLILALFLKPAGK